jgi:hypothetical protein
MEAASAMMTPARISPCPPAPENLSSYLPDISCSFSIIVGYDSSLNQKCANLNFNGTLMAQIEEIYADLEHFFSFVFSL